ncbi:hypothetical protein ACSFB8_12720, partial [Enterococcus faecalis]
ETWLTNEGKIKNSEFSIQKIYSMTATYRLTIGLVLGYLGAQIYSKVDIKLPFAISSFLFFGLTVIILFNFKEVHSNQLWKEVSNDSFLRTYKKSVIS